MWFILGFCRGPTVHSSPPHRTCSGVREKCASAPILMPSGASCNAHAPQIAKPQTASNAIPGFGAYLLAHGAIAWHGVFTRAEGFAPDASRRASRERCSSTVWLSACSASIDHQESSTRDVAAAYGKRTRRRQDRQRHSSLAQIVPPSPSDSRG